MSWPVAVCLILVAFASGVAVMAPKRRSAFVAMQQQKRAEARAKVASSHPAPANIEPLIEATEAMPCTIESPAEMFFTGVGQARADLWLREPSGAHAAIEAVAEAEILDEPWTRAYDRFDPGTPPPVVEALVVNSGIWQPISLSQPDDGETSMALPILRDVATRNRIEVKPDPTWNMDSSIYAAIPVRPETLAAVEAQMAAENGTLLALPVGRMARNNQSSTGMGGNANRKRSGRKGGRR